MRRLCLVLVLLLAGCGGEVGNYSDEVAKVKDYARQICGFLPTDASVRAMLASVSPTVSGAIAIADAICVAVMSPPQGLLGEVGNCPKGEVNGVCIEGDFEPKGSENDTE